MNRIGTQDSVGCMVPYCRRGHCDRRFKGLCALRKYFLLEQVEKRQLLRSVRLSRSARRVLLGEIYFWKRQPLHMRDDNERSRMIFQRVCTVRQERAGMLIMDVFEVVSVQLGATRDYIKHAYYREKRRRGAE